MAESQINPDSEDEAKRLEQLVSWLDSELDDEQTQKIERQIRRDVGLRRQAETLERVWELLDTLEPVSVDHQFTIQTVQSIYENVDGTRRRTEGRTRSGPAVLRSMLQVLIWFSLGFAASLCGLALVRTMTPAAEKERDAQILAQMEMLSRYPEYSAVRNLDVLRELNALSGEKAQPANNAQDRSE